MTTAFGVGGSGGADPESQAVTHTPGRVAELAAEVVPSALAVRSGGRSPGLGSRLPLWCPFYPSVTSHPWALGS